MTDPRASPCCILALDQAKASGWSLWVEGTLQDHGVVKTITGQKAVVDTVVAQASEHGLPLIVMFEDHSEIPLHVGTRFESGRSGKNPRRNTATILGMGAARGRWETCLVLAGVPRSRWLKVTPADWRFPFGIRGTDQQCKEAARHLASMHASKGVRDHNEAEAILIGRWASTARRVATALPRRRKAV